MRTYLLSAPYMPRIVPTAWAQTVSRIIHWSRPHQTPGLRASAGPHRDFGVNCIKAPYSYGQSAWLNMVTSTGFQPNPVPRPVTFHTEHHCTWHWISWEVLIPNGAGDTWVIGWRGLKST